MSSGSQPRLPARLVRRSAGGSAALLVLLGGCGGTSKEPPTPEDAKLVAAAVGDIVYRCGQYTAGTVSAPDVAALEADVDALLDASERLQPEASFEVGAEIGLPQTTSLREQLALASRVLGDGCVPDQAERLADAAD
jgi:hypothetical protein